MPVRRATRHVGSGPAGWCIDYFLSNNGGAKWHRVRDGIEFEFPSSGSDLRWRAVLRSRSPARTPVLSEISLLDASTGFIFRNGFEG